MITIERLEDGEVSPYLVDDVRPGDPIEFLGPIGGFFVWTESMGGPLLLIGGGSGVVPLMAMTRHRVLRSSRTPARLLLSSRAEDDIIYRGELDQIEMADDAFDVFYTLTRHHPDGWKGFSRRIDREMLREVSWGSDEKPLVYICGPTPFVEAAATLLLELGHEPERIRTERFGPTGK
jgi:ferredoxin-NADP reductase